MAARKTAWTPKKVRERIRVGLFLNRLRDHVLGKVEMTPSQVQAATYLISQSIGKPAQSLVHSGEIGHRHSREMSEAELERIASGSSDRAASETASTSDASSLH